MEPNSSPEALPPKDRPATQQKRTRIVLSCAPCRASKLKCDRDQPCSQCQKKSRADLCVYAPKPERKRPAKGMAARVKRLEGMVREMMDSGAGGPGSPAKGRLNALSEIRGQVVQFEESPTYVGATHCLAMLEDIQDIKTYFEEANEDEDPGEPMDDVDSSDIIIMPRSGPRNREELLARLPGREISDRIIMRYFESTSPSQHVMHRPSFQRMYARFWQDSNDVPMHWIAQLFMMMAMGSLFSLFSAPHEIENDSPAPVMERIKEYRNCAGWALVWGKYMHPTPATLPAFILFVESQFVFNRATQMPCYILAGVCMRMMLKMGLHRDPSKLANLTPFEGEMRRRTWNMAIQLDLLVSFHMGLPSIAQSIETDTTSPRNLHDEDFDEDSTELPPGRPSSDYTLMTYPIHKTQILRVFGKIAQQSHSLSVPAYNDVLALDKVLNQVWDGVPTFLKTRPLEECAGESPTILIQRFGLAALFDKCRCVLHRRYIAEATMKPEHDRSRRQCMEGALTLLNNQYIIWQACKPSGTMSSAGWFVSSLAIHDYLLAAVVMYAIVQNEHYSPNGDWLQDMTGMPTKDELKQLIKRSYNIWLDVSRGSPELRKTAGTLATMLGKMGCQIDESPEMLGMQIDEGSASSNGTPGMDPGSTGQNSMDSQNQESGSSYSYGLSGSATSPSQGNYAVSQDVSPLVDKNGMGMNVDSYPGPISFDSAWAAGRDDVDWRFLDNFLAQSYNDTNNPEPGFTFMERAPQPNGLDMMVSDAWSQFAGMDMNGYSKV